MTFAEAAAYGLTFGRYSQKTIDHIASTDQGLLYLDWMRGHLEAGKLGSIEPGKMNSELYVAIKIYLDDPTIANDLAAISRGRR